MWSNITKRIIFIGRFKSIKGFSSRNLSLSLCRYDIISNGILKNSQTVEIPRLSIPEFVFSRSEQFSDLVEYECPITKRSYTYGQVRKRSKNISKMLRKKLGLDRRDTVLVLLQNIPEFPIAVMGCLEADLIVSTANCMYTPEEIARQLRDSQAKLIITSYELYSTAQKASEKLGRKLPIICIKTLQDQSLPRDTIDFEEISTTVLDVPDVEPPNPDDVAILPYSSGTTGLAKGVRLSHYNIVSNLLQVYTVANDLIGTASGNYQETTPTVLPFFHIYGFTITTLLMMLKGVRALTLPRFQPDTYIQTFKDYKINFVYVAPPLILFLTMHPEVKSEYLRHLTFAISGAAPLGSLDEQRFIEKAGQNVLMIQAYGLTETSPVVASNTRTIRTKFLEESKGSIGHVLPNTEVKIVKPGDTTDTPLGPMESGELLVKGPQVMQAIIIILKPQKRFFQTVGLEQEIWLTTTNTDFYISLTE